MEGHCLTVSRIMTVLTQQPPGQWWTKSWGSSWRSSWQEQSAKYTRYSSLHCSHLFSELVLGSNVNSNEMLVRPSLQHTPHKIDLCVFVGKHTVSLLAPLELGLTSRHTALSTYLLPQGCDPHAALGCLLCLLWALSMSQGRPISSLHCY